MRFYSRVQQLEKNYRNAESARFDLSTRVAELQEKVVSSQTKNISLEENVNIVETKAKELQEALEHSNKQSIKMKAQFKAKIKALEEERDMLKKVIFHYLQNIFLCVLYAATIIVKMKLPSYIAVIIIDW